MSTFYNKEVTCGLCGETVNVRIIGSTNAMGYMDLDTRPPEMQRSTMPWWVSECPYCGYVAGDIEEDGSYAADFVKTVEYTGDKEIISPCILAHKFIKKAKLLHLKGRKQAEMMAYLNAAWACDDAHDKKNADICRDRGAEVFNSAFEEHREGEFNMHNFITFLDMRRRAGHFDELIGITEKDLGDEFLEKIMDFEIELAKAGDDKRHSINEVKSIYNDEEDKGMEGNDEGENDDSHSELSYFDLDDDDDEPENENTEGTTDETKPKRSQKLIDFLS